MRVYTLYTLYSLYKPLDMRGSVYRVRIENCIQSIQPYTTQFLTNPLNKPLLAKSHTLQVGLYRVYGVALKAFCKVLLETSKNLDTKPLSARFTKPSNIQKTVCIGLAEKLSNTPLSASFGKNTKTALL
jgi:hypothetical protein